MLFYSSVLCLLLICPSLIATLPLPVDINLQQANITDNLSFSLSLPNNDTVQIGLSFRLLTFTNGTNLLNTTTTTTDTTSFQNDASVTSTTARTVNTILEEKKIVTVEEAIESFRQDLIKKETEISGIIQSKDVFYRHFKLEFDEDKALTVRCSYDSNYNLRTLSIKCYEYHEYETERVLSNGEVEIFMKEDLAYKSDVELLNFKSLKQSYHMNIS